MFPQAAVQLSCQLRCEINGGFSVSFVVTKVGAMALTRMPRSAHSAASARVMLTSAPLVA